MKIFAYTMTYNTGFAPAVYKGLLSLACCKTDMRYQVAQYIEQSKDSDVYLIGLRGKQMARRNGIATKPQLLPVYIAKVSSVVNCAEYYNSSEYRNRPDRKYEYRNGVWYIERNNPHHTGIEERTIYLNAAMDKDLRYIRRNKNEENYVLLAKDYIYYGGSINDYPDGSLEAIANERAKSARCNNINRLSEQQYCSFSEFFRDSCRNGISDDIGHTIDEYFDNDSNTHRTCEGTIKGGNL